MKKEKILKISRIIIATSLILLIIVTIARNYGFETYTYYWHIMHSEPVKWNNLEITVPDQLIAKFINDEKSNNDLSIIYMRDAYQVSLFFMKVNFHLNTDFNIEVVFNKLGYKIIKETPCNILGKACIWVKSKRQKKKSNYREDIFFLTDDLQISFRGSRDKSHYLVDIVSPENLTLIVE